MTKTSKTIIFFGTDEFSLVTLQELVENNYKVGLVITKPDSKSGRGHKLQSPIVKDYAVKNGIKVLQPNKISDINDEIKHLGPDVFGVVVVFGKIISQSTIDLFQGQIVNIHPSLLPLYRGPSPIESAIKNGDTETGISIIKITKDMDAGPIYSQSIHKLSGKETRPELYRALAKEGANFLISIMPSIIDGTLTPTEQNDDLAVYCKLLSKDESLINPGVISAAAAERQIRAYLTYPKTKLNIFGETIIITKAHVTETKRTPLDVLCADNKYLSIDELISANGRTMSAGSFLNGIYYNN